VATDSEQSFQAAKKVYEEGGNSKSVALLTLATGLTTSVAKNTAVTGVGKVVTSVVGKAYDDFEAGATSFQAQYESTDVQETYMECRVGGLPSEFQVTDGCKCSLSLSPDYTFYVLRAYDVPNLEIPPLTTTQICYISFLK
jgi:hypothetical protein